MPSPSRAPHTRARHAAPPGRSRRGRCPALLLALAAGWAQAQAPTPAPTPAPSLPVPAASDALNWAAPAASTPRSDAAPPAAPVPSSAPSSAATSSPGSVATPATTTPVPSSAAEPASAAPRSPGDYDTRDDVQRFAQETADRYALDPAWVAAQMAQARYLPAVARAIMPPPVGTPKNWFAYRARFVEPRRVNAGVAFWQRHAAYLAKAEAMYGVPAEIVMGIIGVETLYGQHMGNFRVVDALATLAFDFPPGRRDRSAFFREELAQLLVLANREQIDPPSLRGSYAGALGLPQFMPSSWNRYAIDFDRDGHVDLRGNPADAIGSVAHYLAAFGWTPGMPTVFEVAPPADATNRATLLAPDIVPSFSAADFQRLGAVLAPEARGFEGKLALVEVQNGDRPPTQVAGTANFYAITRYNWSSYYALAVIELGAAVAKAMAAAR